jgi:formate dehydrogenase major subunit
VRLRPGTDTPLIYGLLWHIFENGWEDTEYISQRVYGMDKIREEAANWPPKLVEDVTGVPEAEVKLAAQTMAENRPGTIVWCMGGTQHTIGNNNTRAYCALQLALGNIGVSGGGANIFRGHDNVQGATDLGVLANTLPAYYGLSEGAWRHWSAVWGLDFEWVKGQFDPESYEEVGGAPVSAMNTKGIPVSRWIDGVLEDKENIAQKDNIRAMFRRIRPCCRIARTTCTCCRLRPSSKPTAQSRHPTARCNGASRSSTRCSSRYPITPSCTGWPRSSVLPNN